VSWITFWSGIIQAASVKNVMAGLDPANHVSAVGVDPRVKPGDDNEWGD
jgi:hypothetical protein